MAEIEDIGRVGDIRISVLNDHGAGEAMMQEVAPVPVSEAPAIKKRLRHNRRRKAGSSKGGKFQKDPGRKAMGLVRAGERAYSPWDFRKATGLVPLKRAGAIQVAKLRDALEDSVGQLFAGSKPGLYTWKVAQSALRHEMRAVMMEQILAEDENLTLEQKLLLIKHLCDASDKCDEAMKRIGLDRLSEMPDAIDPMDVMPLPPAELPADVLSPRERSPEEIIGEYEETGEVTSDDSRQVPE